MVDKKILDKLYRELGTVFGRFLPSLPERTQIKCTVEVVLPAKLSHIDISIELNAKEEVVWVREHNDDRGHIAPSYEEGTMLCGLIIPGSPIVFMAKECPEEWVPCRRCEELRGKS